MRDLIAPPSAPALSGDAAAQAQALFIEARRRRRRRWLAGAAAVLVAAAVAVSADTWLPGTSGQDAGQTGTAGTALTGRSSGLATHARYTYRVVTAGIPEAYGTKDIAFSGKNLSLFMSQVLLPRASLPAQTEAGTERIIDGKIYVLYSVRGRPRWAQQPLPVLSYPKIIDPRRLLHALAVYTRFQPSGHQMIDGVRLEVLRAADPGNLTRRNVLPVMYTSGHPVGSLLVWVDAQRAVHRMTFTFLDYSRIAFSRPVSQAALRKYHQAKRAQSRLLARSRKPGHRDFRRRLQLALRRLLQAGMRAFPVRRGTQVTTIMVTFSAIGQAQHITVPPHVLSAHRLARLSSRPGDKVRLSPGR